MLTMPLSARTEGASLPLEHATPASGRPSDSADERLALAPLELALREPALGELVVETGAVMAAGASACGPVLEQDNLGLCRAQLVDQGAHRDGGEVVQTRAGVSRVRGFGSGR